MLSNVFNANLMCWFSSFPSTKPRLAQWLQASCAVFAEKTSIEAIKNIVKEPMEPWCHPLPTAERIVPPFAFRDRFGSFWQD
jgi:hypothetical protein